jgi:hypothetical protein
LYLSEGPLTQAPSDIFVNHFSHKKTTRKRKISIFNIHISDKISYIPSVLDKIWVYTRAFQVEDPDLATNRTKAKRGKATKTVRGIGKRESMLH